MSRIRGRPALLLAGWSLLVVLLWALWFFGLRQPMLTAWHRASPGQHTVMLVVLDTVRADHLSLCGYERPTSPFLEELAEQGAAFSCRAYAPGSWTFPSHASYFTGLPVPVHGSHFVQDGVDIRKLVIRPLDASYETLAESFAGRGYTTVGISANPVLQPASGLDQGFGHWEVAPGFGAYYGQGLVTRVRDALRAIEDKERPLFLFVNISDAHDPWFGVPENAGWLPAREDRLVYFETDAETGEILPDGPWQRYVTGALSESEALAFRERVRDNYDWALSRADETLRQVMEQVEDHGWAEAGLRLVIVSDHGEFLGEHGLLQHGHYLWEENQRVPLVFFETGRGGLDFPEPVSALAVHSLVLEGRLPVEALPVEAAAFPDRTWQEQSGGRVGKETSAARWEGQGKHLWIDEVRRRYDLGADPQEMEPLPLGEDPALDALVEQVKGSRDRRIETDPELIEALRAAGYVE